MKRWLLVLIVLFLLITITGCYPSSNTEEVGLENNDEMTPQDNNAEEGSLSHNDEITDDTKETEVLEMTILMPEYESGTQFPATLSYYYSFLQEIKDGFEKEEGIKVNLQVVSGNYYTDYKEERDLILNSEEAPDLTFIHVWESSEDLIKSGMVDAINDTLEHHDKLYTGFKDDYFLPIGVYCPNSGIKKSFLDSHNLENPGYQWGPKDYLTLRNLWLEEEEIHFNLDEYWNSIKLTWHEIDIYDEDTAKVDLDNKEIKDYIKAIRQDLLSGRYLFQEGYTSQNFVNMLTDFRTQEFREGIKVFKEELNRHFLINPYEERKNLLNPLNANTVFNNSEAVVLPDIIEGGKVWSFGFVLNHRGQHKKEAVAFLDYLLRDDIQLKIYELGKESNGMAPVSRAIEKKIEELNQRDSISSNAIETRQYILNQVEKGAYKLYNINAEKEEIKIEFAKKIVGIIFADEPLADDQIIKELEKIENEMNKERTQ